MFDNDNDNDNKDMNVLVIPEQGGWRENNKLYAKPILVVKCSTKIINLCILQLHKFGLLILSIILIWQSVFCL